MGVVEWRVRGCLKTLGCVLVGVLWVGGMVWYGIGLPLSDLDIVRGSW